MYQTKENGTIQSLPYDKFLQQGAENLTEEELIAIILRTGTRGEDALTLACRVLSVCDKRHGIFAELSRRMAVARVEKDAVFRNPQVVAQAYMERLRHLEKEYCIALYLDTKDSRIKDVELSIGNINSSIMSARELFRQALLCNAASVIIMHNHPSGDPSPSREDLLLTERIGQAAAVMEIPLLDHIIIGDNTYISLKEKGVL